MKVRNLAKLAPTQIRRFPLKDIVCEKGNGKQVVLHLVHCGDSNKGWRDASDKLDALGGAADGLEWVRVRAPAFAKFGIVGWDNAFDDNGKAEEYTPALGEKLLVDLLDNGGGDLVHLGMRTSFDPKNHRDMLPEGTAERLGNG